MREMKDSGVEWIGEIPRDWDTIPVKRYFHSPKRVVGADADKYARLALTMNGVIQRSKEDNDGLQPEKFEGYQILKDNELVFKLIDLENVKTSRVGLSSYTGLVSPAYIVLSSELSDNRFFYYWFISMYYNEVFNHLGGEGVRSALNASDVLRLPTVTIPEKQMHRIANYLDAKCAQIDRVIARQQEVIEKLKEYKLSVITEAVTKGLNPDVPMKDSGIEWIGKIPEGWDLLKLRFAVENIGDIDHYMPASVDIGIPYVMTGDLHDLASAINFQECKMVSTEDYVELSSKISIKKGDLLFARYATIGTMCYVDLDREFLVSYSCVIIKPNEDLMLGKFLYYVMKSNTFAEEVKQYTNSNTQGNVGIEALYRSKVVVPSVSLQKEIIGFLEEKCTLIDKSIDSKMGLVNKLEEYKKSLIYEVVTGKREV